MIVVNRVGVLLLYYAIVVERSQFGLDDHPTQSIQSDADLEQSRLCVTMEL